MAYRSFNTHIHFLHRGLTIVVYNKNQVPQTSCVQNKNKRVIDEMTRVDQSGAKAAAVDDVTRPPTNQAGLSPPVNLR